MGICLTELLNLCLVKAETALSTEAQTPHSLPPGSASYNYYRSFLVETESGHPSKSWAFINIDIWGT
jgi:hypothetical protein